MGNANEPRRHHYVPVAYLRHFTDTGMSNGVLDVIDGPTKKKWRSSPQACGYAKNHFASLDADGNVTSVLVEKLRADLEGNLAPAFARAAHGQADAAALDAVVALAALLHVGAPRMRTATQAGLEQALATGRAIQAGLLAGQGTMPPVVAGTDDPPGILHTDLERALADNTVHNQLAAFGVEGLPVVRPFLARRHWTLFVASPAAGQFLTADAPLLCDWAVVPSPAGPWVPSIADSRAVLVLPLSKQVLAMGWAEPAVLHMEADRQFVAALNFAQVRALIRQAYLPSGDVPCLSPAKPGCIVDAREVFDELRQSCSAVRPESR